MAWYAYVAYFFAGAFLANGVPHFIHGISGERFQSPFASRPGMRESSALVNVVWGLANLAVGYGLIFEVGHFDLGLSRSSQMAGLGVLITSVTLALTLGRVRYGWKLFVLAQLVRPADHSYLAGRGQRFDLPLLPVYRRLHYLCCRLLGISGQADFRTATLAPQRRGKTRTIWGFTEHYRGRVLGRLLIWLEFSAYPATIAFLVEHLQAVEIKVLFFRLLLHLYSEAHPSIS
jgi:hypothetical protein